MRAGIRTAVVLFSSLLAPVALWAGAVTLPHGFSNGVMADATQVNENFDALKDAVNARHGEGAALPETGARGDFFSRDDGRLYFHDGAKWRLLQVVSEAPALPAGVAQGDVLHHFTFDGNVTDTGTGASGTSVVGTLSYATGAFDLAATGFSLSNAVATNRFLLSSHTTTGMTLAAWVKGTNTSGSGGAYQVGNNVFGDTNTQVWMGSGVSNGRAAVKGSTTEYLSTASVADGAWHHLAFVFTYAGGTWSVQIHVDGVADGGGALPTGGNGYYGVNSIGRTHTSYTQSYGYMIDHVHAFSKALSAQQVAALAVR